MKTAVGVIFTAALGTALPHVETSTTTFCSRSTDAAIESKIPWVEYKGDSRACIDAVRKKATRQKLEEACGTENFCDLWDPEDGPDNLKDKSERYGYANKTECLAAHEPKP